jgi:hypothetical protein
MRDRTCRCGAVESPLDSKPSSNIPFDKLPGVGATVQSFENGNSDLDHSSAAPELMDFLGKQGVPWKVFQFARKPVSEAHNRQETPLFAKSIDRHAFKAKVVLGGQDDDRRITTRGCA